MSVIELEGVRKRYFLSRDRPMLVKELLVHPFRRTSFQEELWALDGVSFALERGGTLGIVGPNGSGKSTLLKIISGVTVATEGRMRVDGRVGSLLELGAGFHPDLTGRENVYLMGAMMGARRAEIDAKYDSIVDFSGLGTFVESPVRQYSWGMYVRLAFSVTVHMDFDILVVDEVLAVGDYAFQLKCFKAIAELKRRGVTLILVSHNLGAVRNACDRSIFLYKGKTMVDGPVEEVIQTYVRFTNEQALADARGLATDERVSDTGVKRDLEITDLRMTDAGGAAREVFETGSPLRLEVRYLAHRRIERANFIVTLFGNDGLLYADASTLWDGLDLDCPAGEGKATLEVENLTLLPGIYRASVNVVSAETLEAFDAKERAWVLQVVSKRAIPGQGLTHLPHRWRLDGPVPRGAEGQNS